MSIAKKVANTINDNERGYLCRDYDTCSTVTPVRTTHDIGSVYNKYIPTNEVVSIYPARTNGSDDELVQDFVIKSGQCKLAYIAVAFEFADGSVLGVIVDRYREINNEAIKLCKDSAIQASKAHEAKLVDCFVKHCYEVLHDSKC